MVKATWEFSEGSPSDSQKGTEVPSWYYHGPWPRCFNLEVFTPKCFRDTAKKDIEPWYILICFVILGRFLLPFGVRD